MSLDSALIDERRTAYSELKNSSKNIEENNVSNFLDNPDTYKIGEIIHEKLLNLFHYVIQYIVVEGENFNYMHEF